MTDLRLSIESHWLTGRTVTRRPGTPNTGGAYAKGLPDTVVMHYTAGATAAAAISWFMNPRSRVSAHLIIDRDGKISQLIPFDHKAWHSGTSSWGERTNLNNYSLGIEMVNCGVLSGEPGHLLTWFNTRIPDSQAILAPTRAVAGAEAGKPRWWHSYSPRQVDATWAVCRLLVVEVGIRTILGHDEISPGRKFDPGPALDLDKLRKEVLG